MKRLFVLFVCALFLSVNVISARGEEEKPYDHSGVVRAIGQLHLQANDFWPEHFRQGEERRRGNEFDPSEYFRVLTHIAPEQGFVLEYLYCGGMNGRPVFYWRTVMDPGPENCEFPDLLAGRGTELQRIAAHLKLDGTLESFYELFVFNTLAGQFYLSWHANYDDTRIIVSQDDVEAVIAEVNGSDFGSSFDASQEKEARALDVTPRVEFWDEEAAEVSVVVFSKWGGFQRITQRIRRLSPHTVLHEQNEKLVEYNCGVMY